MLGGVSIETPQNSICSRLTYEDCGVHYLDEWPICDVSGAWQKFHAGCESPKALLLQPQKNTMSMFAGQVLGVHDVVGHDASS